jgi:mannosyltransferase
MVWLAAATVFACHVALKGWHLSAASLWLDEAGAVHYAQRSIIGVLRASQTDTSPPLYYLVLAAAERVLGIGEAAVRWPSVLASAASAAALFLLALRILGWAGAWLATALFLVSDVNLHFAREARPYTLAVFLAILSFSAFLRFRERPTWRHAGIVSVLSLLLFFTHYVTIFIPVAQCLALVLPRRNMRALARLIAAHAPAAAIAAAWLAPVFASGQQGKMGWLAGPTHRIGRVLGWYAGGMHWPGIFALMMVGALAALFAARRRGSAPDRELTWTLGLWALAPVGIAFLVSFAWPCLHSRYLLYVTPGLVLFWAVAVMSLPVGWNRTCGVIVACALASAGFGRSIRPKTDWRSAAAFVRATRADRVLLLPEYDANTLAYYLDRAAFRDPDHTRSRLEADGVVFTTEKELWPSDLGGARVLVLLEGLHAAEVEQVQAALAQLGYVADEERRWPGVRAVRLSKLLVQRDRVADRGG